MNSRLFARSLLIALLAAAFAGQGAFARDAAFLNPNAVGGVAEQAVKVDPKPDVEMGETMINVQKRATIFFVNQTNVAIKIEKVSLSSDASVTAEETANDCTKLGSIAPLSRCSVEISVTPSAPGSWSVEVLMTHNGAGRITSARLSGKTSGQGSGEGKSMGLAISSKEVKPIDFGTVDLGGGKIVRSTLMVNDSSDPITIYSIDVIEADNGLQKLKEGCAVDMELAPGASCPVTLLWEPQEDIPISTDLIIRHSGKLGFAVIPIRGQAKGEGGGSGGGNNISGNKNGGAKISKKGIPSPPSADQIEKEVAGRITPVPDSSLEAAVGRGSSSSAADGKLHLIGTIGDRALFFLPSGDTAIVATGDNFETYDGTAKLLSVGPRTAEYSVEGKKITLSLEAASSLVNMAMEQSKKDKESGGKKVPAPSNGAK